MGLFTRTVAAGAIPRYIYRQIRPIMWETRRLTLSQIIFCQVCTVSQEIFFTTHHRTFWDEHLPQPLEYATFIILHDYLEFQISR